MSSAMPVGAIDHAVDLARINLHAIDRLAEHGACEQLVVLVEGKPCTPWNHEPGTRSCWVYSLGSGIAASAAGRGLLRHGVARQRHGARERTGKRHRREKPRQSHPLLRPPHSRSRADFRPPPADRLPLRTLLTG
jgi:hypothetical protein